MSESFKQQRHNARIIVLQKLFEKAFQTSDLSWQDSSKSKFPTKELQLESEISSYDKAFVKELWAGVNKYQAQMDEIIKELAPEWPIANIGRTDLQILHIAIVEGFILQLTPEKVAIDEAIELAKEFSNDQSRKFVNGVLGNLIMHKQKFKLVI